MKILVTGSAGFIGFHVCRRLLADGHDVAGIDAMVPYYDLRLKQARLDLLAASPRFRNHRLDIADMTATANVLAAESPEIIIHLAAQAGVRYSLENPESYVSSNVVGSFNLLEICRRAPVRHFLMASTSSAYGGSTRMPFRETDPAATPLTIYAATKLSAEAIAHSYAHLWNQPATTFRFFTVYGPWGRPDMALFKFTAAALRGEAIDVYNDGRMARDFTYVDDLVEAIVRLIPCVPEAGKPVCAADSVSPVAPYRLVNIGNGAPRGLLDYIAALERCLGREIARTYLPMQPGDIARTWADVTLLEALTGFRPSTSVETGVARFVEWYRAHYGDAGPG